MSTRTGQTAVVTGAASGIGEALVRRAAADGMQVVLADVDVAGMEAVAGDLDTETLCVRCDVSDRASVAALADAARSRFGSVHLLANNAGVGGGGMIAEATQADWDWVLGVNLNGVISGVSEFLPAMIDSGEAAHIVNVASMAGHLAGPGMGAYSVSKYGVVALSETMRAELAGSPVSVSVLCPGWVSTRIHESDRSRPEWAGPGREPADPAQRDAIRAVIESGMAPAAVADLVFDAWDAKRFWVFTHPEMVAFTKVRNEEILAHSPELL